MRENCDSGEQRNHGGSAAMQDRDRFPGSADWRLMSQLGERNTLNGRVHNTRGPEGNIALVSLNDLRLPCRGIHGRIFLRLRLRRSQLDFREPFIRFAIEVCPRKKKKLNTAIF